MLDLPRRGDPAEHPVIVERRGDRDCAALVILNQPAQLNALDTVAIQSLSRALTELAADPSVRCVLLTGAGRAFCTGGDLKGFASFQSQADVFTAFVDSFLALLDKIRSMPKPVVALINGTCVAGGLELVLACDFAYAAESARIGDGHLNFGQVGGAGAMSAMPRAIGAAKSRELIYSGRLLSAEQAREWGLVNRVTDDDGLLAAGVAFAAEVAVKSPAATAAVKQVLDAGARTDLDAAGLLERLNALRFCATDPDAAEGVLAFGQRRQPVWASAADGAPSQGSESA